MGSFLKKIPINPYDSTDFHTEALELCNFELNSSEYHKGDESHYVPRNTIKLLVSRQ